MHLFGLPPPARQREYAVAHAFMQPRFGGTIEMSVVAASLLEDFLEDCFVDFFADFFEDFFADFFVELFLVGPFLVAIGFLTP